MVNKCCSVFNTRNPTSLIDQVLWNSMKVPPFTTNYVCSLYYLHCTTCFGLHAGHLQIKSMEFIYSFIICLTNKLTMQHCSALGQTRPGAIFALIQMCTTTCNALSTVLSLTVHNFIFLMHVSSGKKKSPS
jgi:hypothetical protein